ncbi:MAG: uracil-DNA glycosylase [Gammaproteobacteria bacterium]|nr:uracil-DNA glycosylase [Gammaproteobacteria bacterium]MCY4219125.1 uracil-DNA glycosylase [Gammaproteobacteria bacterium]MCY4275808.1 uracil-DNA glycosylase [Gammaproteobacteria bacterium]
MKLDRRRSQILGQMGIAIWKSRLPSDNDLTQGDLNIEDEIEQIEEPISNEVVPRQFANLEEIASAVRSCRLCQLSHERKNAVPGTGNPTAEWMFVGEAPGQDEDLQGKPFVGRSGQLLNSMFAALGLTRDQVFIANVIKCRPPRNRDPSDDEVFQCTPYLKAQIAMIQPRVIVALGRISARLLLDAHEKTPISELRGDVHTYEKTGIPLVVTYHPAYLLRSPDQKRVAWQDLLLARSQMK